MSQKRRFARVSIVAVVVLALALIGVHTYNLVCLDPGAWRANAEPLLARARAISERARPEYQDLALATLPPNPHNGPFYRLDDRLHETEIVEQPPAVAEAWATTARTTNGDPMAVSREDIGDVVIRARATRRRGRPWDDRARVSPRTPGCTTSTSLF